jgi:hypothetical protein
MSGYLARLIAHAKVPPASIRPLARPLFAPAPGPPAAAPLFEEATEVSAPPRPAGTFAQSRQTSEASTYRVADRAPLDRSEFDPSSLDQHSGPDRRNGSSRGDDDGRRGQAFTPLMPMREERLDRFAEMPSERVAESSTRPTPDQAMGPRLHDASRTTAIQPLMPAPASRPRLTAVPAPAAPPPMDEVQIHIGRIEISAVPPVSPRPAARTPHQSHRGVNLDDYLRKGKGSAR